MARSQPRLPPSTTTNNPFTLAHDTSLLMFEYMLLRPALDAQFNNHKGSYRLGRPSWSDPSVYPIPSRLLADYNLSSWPLLAEIGGNLGHDLLRFRSAFPSAHVRLILQDTPSVATADSTLLAKSGHRGNPP